jgi:hypothetical protein
MEKFMPTASPMLGLALLAPMRRVGAKLAEIWRLTPLKNCPQ